jgi:threonine dehydratase
MSAGNHAQGVARAAGRFNIPATILMPLDAPGLKVAKTKSYGANVEFYDRNTQDREQVGREIAETRKLTVIHPFNALATIAGQGTIGLEIFEQTSEKDTAPDALIIPCSGGGLSAGCAEANAFYEECGIVPPQIYTAEPEGLGDAAQSLKSGVICQAANKGDALCDALTAPQLGEIPFGILRDHKAEGFVATHSFVKAAMAMLQIHFNIGTEGGGATALACILQNREQFRNKIVAAVISGGNIDLEKQQEAVKTGRTVLQQMLPQLAL